MRAFALLARVFSLIVVDCAARGGGQEKLTQELILAASPFVKANNGWKPSSLARQLILSSGRTTWGRRTDSEEGRRQQQQARRGGRSLYSPYSPGLDALRCDNIFSRPTKDFLLFTLESNSGLYLCLRFVRFPFLIISWSETPRWRYFPPIQSQGPCLEK